MKFLKKLFKAKETKTKVNDNDYFIDLTRFKCNNTRLGEQPTLKDHFYESFDDDLYEDEYNGIEIGLSHKLLDSVYVSLKEYKGKFLADDNKLNIGLESTEKDIIKLFGEPYWRDEDEKEVILFYEDDDIELQFEFPEKSTLEIITMMRSPILEDPQQRKYYKVTKCWPPNTRIQITTDI